jgi:DNA-binding NarL/FixJ family response regulator
VQPFGSHMSPGRQSGTQGSSRRASQARVTPPQDRATQAGTRPVRIVLVDGEELFRQGLRLVLERSGAAHVVVEATGLEEACAAVRRADPEVVVTDYRLRGEQDGGVVSEFLRLWPELPVVVLTEVPPEECLQALLQAGVQGFVMKSAAVHLVALALAAVRSGDIWVQREAFARVVRSMRRAAEQGADLKAPLSTREQEVLALLASGASTTEIAEALFISQSTVRVHAQRLSEKLGAKSRIEAVRRALRLGLVAS